MEMGPRVPGLAPVVCRVSCDTEDRVAPEEGRTDGEGSRDVCITGRAEVTTLTSVPGPRGRM